jgi:hypothetical protein
MNPSNAPRNLTSTVGSYPIPDWLAALPSEQALLDATRVLFNLQRQAGIDLPTDGKLKIRDGRVALGSVNTAPLGVKPLIDPSRSERQPIP